MYSRFLGIGIDSAGTDAQFFTFCDLPGMAEHYVYVTIHDIKTLLDSPLTVKYLIISIYGQGKNTWRYKT